MGDGLFAACPAGNPHEHLHLCRYINTDLAGFTVWDQGDPITGTGAAWSIGEFRWDAGDGEFAFDTASGSGGHLDFGGLPPTGSCITGSLYTNPSGGSGTTLYVCESSVWVAK